MARFRFPGSDRTITIDAVRLSDSHPRLRELRERLARLGPDLRDRFDRHLERRLGDLLLHVQAEFSADVAARLEHIVTLREGLADSFDAVLNGELVTPETVRTKLDELDTALQGIVSPTEFLNGKTQVDVPPASPTPAPEVTPSPAPPPAPARPARRRAPPPSTPEVGVARQVVGRARKARAQLDRLERLGLHDIIEDIAGDLVADPALARRLLERLEGLSDKQLRALERMQRLSEDSGLGPQSRPLDWVDVLELDPEFRNDLLDLTADVMPSVDSGLDLALTRGFYRGATFPQGVLGHLFAARTLLAKFPGARLHFEVPELQAVGSRLTLREIDIRMEVDGRVIDVEVKTYLDPAFEFKLNQIKKDVLRHVGDGWEGVQYLFAPEYATRLADVEDAFRQMLLDPDVQAALAQAGISPLNAELTLEERIHAGMIGTFDY